MKIPLVFPCSECREGITISINLDDSSVEFTGPCGHKTTGGFGLSFTRGPRILHRANHELVKQDDCSTAIIFSAMAFEAELSRLHHKWEGIAALLDDATEVTDEILDKTLRRYGNIKDKIEHVCRLMHKAGIDDFVRSDPALRDAIDNRFPSLNVGSLARDLQERLFWPRNRILHLGRAEHKRENADVCFNIATIGLRILQRLDEEKRKN